MNWQRHPSHAGTVRRHRHGDVTARAARRLLVLAVLLSLLGSRPVQAAQPAPSATLPATTSLPRGAVAPANLSSVSKPAVALSTTAAGANAVTYTIGFTTSATGAIPAGGTITLVAPPGTIWPGTHDAGTYALTDATTPSGSFTGAQSVHLAAPGLPIYNFLDDAGASVTITVPNAIKAGDALSLAVSGVVNPGAGSDTLAVSTSADLAPATSAGYTITAPGSVGRPAVTLSTTAAGAGAVTYTIGFRTSGTGAIPPGGTITLVAPPGTLWSNNNCFYALTDATTPGGSFTCAQSAHPAAPGLPIYGFEGPSGASVTITVPNAIKAGDALSLAVSGVVNPGAGSDTLAVSTSADPTQTLSAPYTITPSASVSRPSVALSTTAGGASAVTYTVAFRTSATGAVPAGGAITLVAPPGTLWSPSNCAYALTDATTPGGSFTCAQSAHPAAPGLPIYGFEGPSGASVTITVPNAIKAGDLLSLTASGVVNPGAGSDTLSIFTSADPTPIGSASYTITAPGSVSTPAVALSSTASGATGVTYTLGFKTSATGAIPAGGTITLSAPPGTIWSSNNCAYALTDTTTPGGSFGCANGVRVAGNGSFVSLTVPNAIKAGDALSLAVSGVTNPGAGIHELAMFTSADPTPATSSSYTLTGTTVSLTAVSGVNLSLSTTAAGATGVTYTVGFTTSSAGQITGGSGTITLVAPVGTIFGPCPYGCGGGNATYTITDHTHASGSGGASPAAIVAGGAVVSIVPANTIQAGDQVTLTITQVTNPPAVTGAITLFTSSDAALAGVADPIGAARSVASPSLSLSTTAAGATGVTYTIDFTVSGTGQILGGLGAITLAAPAGTIFESCGGCGAPNAIYTITDHTHASGSGGANPVALTGGGSVLSVVPNNTIQAGDQVTLTITQVTNPPAAGTLTVSTSSDPIPANVADPIGAARSVASPSLSLSTTAAGANGVTYTIDFTVSGTGALEGGFGVITLAAPAGTIFGPCPYGCGGIGQNAIYTITDLTHSSGSGAAYPVAIAGGNPNIGGGGSVVSVVPNNTIQAGDQITLSITQVTNPPAAGAITLSTSSDSTPVSVADPIGAAHAVSSPYLALSTTIESATGVTYAAGFVASGTGALLGGLGAITLAATPGTIFSPTGQITITDYTTPSGSGTAGGADVIGTGSIVSFVVPNTIKAGDTVGVAVSGVTNPTTTGAQRLAISTSSDPALAAAGYTLVPGTSISGTVLASGGGGAAGAALQACPASGSCAFGVTDGSGTFTLYVPLPAGAYTLAANPPPGSRDAPGTATVTVGSTPLTGVAVQLGPPPTLKSGFTVVSPNFGTEGPSTPNPVVRWDQPFTVQIDPSIFPTGGTVIATQLVIDGTNSQTGQPMAKVVNIGGSVGGLPVGMVIGAQSSGSGSRGRSASAPLSITVPPLAPMHGTSYMSVNYVVYPSGYSAPVSANQVYVAATQVLDLVYPDPENLGILGTLTDLEPAFFTDTGVQGISMGPGAITGADASHFSIVPLSTAYAGGSSGVPDCSTSSTLLQPFVDDSSLSTSECGIAIKFTPTTPPTKAYYHATLDVQVNTPGVVMPVSLDGCDERVAVELVGCYGSSAGDLGDGLFVGSSSGGGGPINANQSGGGNGIDPSGTVSVTDGHAQAVPLAGATVTLEHGPTLTGPFSPVPNGSSLMTPANRTNPGTTDAQGAFGWDVLAGFYQVTATSPGCTAASTSGLAIPPPVTGLSLTLTCPTMPARHATQVSLSSSSPDATYGQPVTLTATVTGSGAPTGTVTFLDGTTPIGTGVLDNGSATLTLATLSSGSHSITASYGGDAANQPATSLPVTQDVTLTASVAAAAGWSLIDLPLSSTGPISASAVLAGILQQGGGHLAAIYGLSKDAWSPSLIQAGAGAPVGKDFTLLPGQGYLVYSAQPGSYVQRGAIPATQPAWTLAPGWNLGGISLGATGPISASTVLAGILGKGGGHLAAIYGLSKNAWSPSLIQTRGAAPVGKDFVLLPGAGYLLYADVGTSYTPGAGAISPSRGQGLPGPAGGSPPATGAPPPPRLP